MVKTYELFTSYIQMSVLKLCRHPKNKIFFSNAKLTVIVVTVFIKFCIIIEVKKGSAEKSSPVFVLFVFLSIF